MEAGETQAQESNASKLPSVRWDGGNVPQTREREQSSIRSQSTRALKDAEPCSPHIISPKENHSTEELNGFIVCLFVS